MTNETEITLQDEIDALIDQHGFQQFIKSFVDTMDDSLNDLGHIDAYGGDAVGMEWIAWMRNWVDVNRKLLGEMR